MAENKYYERKIKYLDLMENGERVGGAGFIKIEVKGMEVSLAVTVKGLHPTDTYEREVMLQSGDDELSVGRIALKEGQGQFKYHTVMDCSRLQGIRIALGGIREISCRWQEEKRSSVMRNSAVKNDEERSDTISGGNAGETAEIEPEKHEPGKRREIQLIPWDEIKVVEESLERTERMMSKPLERESWRAEKKAVSRTMTREKAERDMAAGEMELQKASGRDKTARRSVETEIAEREAAAEKTLTREAAAGKLTADEAMGKEVTTAGSLITGRSAEKETTTGRTAKTAVPDRSNRSKENSVREGGRNLGTENAPGERSTERRAERPVRRSISNSSGREKKPVRLMEDKWQQIWTIYPHIHPFQDEREYLSISPADFVLLTGDAYRAANNSFLLHGYYNYDHLILTKIERRGEVSYYIGVPGNYYEREKQVAIMFGFDSFECGTEPAQAGDFGYYMMRTQL